MKNHELLFVAFGSLGDVYPLLAIAKRMNKTHKITFIANEYFRSHVEKSGVPFFAAGTIGEQLTALETRDSSGESAAGRVSRFENLIGKNFSRIYKFIEAKVNEGTRMVVISHGNLSPAVPACEKFCIPMVLAYYAPSQIPDNREANILFMTYCGQKEWLARYVILPLMDLKNKLWFDIKDSYNKYRQEFGLSPIPNIFIRLMRLMLPAKKGRGLITPLEIVLLPKWFTEPIDKKLDHLKFAGFPFYDNTDEELNRKVDAFVNQHGKPMVFTPGTAVEDVEEFCDQIIPICRKLGSPGIFASKHGKEAFEKLEQAEDVPLMYIEHADFAHLLPQSRCLVHHGGVGTIAQAIKAGIPQIIRPRMYDQPMNAVHVILNGLGGVLHPKAYSADSLANILTYIEKNPNHQEHLSYYQAEVNKENGLEKSCALIEDYLNSYFYPEVAADADYSHSVASV